MSNIDKQALLVSEAKASVFTMEYISQFEASDIDSDDIDLRFEVDDTETGTTVSIVDECGHAAQIITALLDENLQLQREKDAIEAVALALRDDMRQAREQLEAAEKRNAEQREYYEGVIADGGKRIAELEAKLETADKLQDSAFRDGLKAGFSYGQTDDQSGFAQCMSAYSTRAGIKVKGE
ncbi:ead/Ea22-like family protein [Salmonella enterica]|nr:ead/Ea22-like family protein [Salmonella enterica subsp. enterica]ECV2872425.1 ead/Ea22-like family protein [Salmonella enterica]ECC9711729.1 ead/Ea22-like family protein [Salmonella enterica subsp. enterica]ECH8937269.1 ead/Ea22-like family protein [Salmonella enterica subsp. enterica]EDF9457965.1 ead/Ea22-like family protein [Salmonella enterica]